MIMCSYPYPQSPDTFTKDGVTYQFTDEFMAYCNYMCPQRDRYIGEGRYRHNSCDLGKLQNIIVKYDDLIGNVYWPRQANALTLKRCDCLAAFNRNQKVAQPKISGVKSFVQTKEAAPLRLASGYAPAVVEMTRDISVEVPVTKEVSVEVSVDMTDEVQVKQLEVMSSMLSTMCDMKCEMREANMQKIQMLSSISNQLSSMSCNCGLSNVIVNYKDMYGNQLAAIRVING